MVKKIVFSGPMNAGKSTLRKWIFEGESLFKLLENPLEPTYGFENYSYNLLQNLGVFDLAGQESEKWFHEEKSIFNDSDIIINVLDSRFAPKILIDKISEALKVQKQQAPNADIFFLIHKIDLIDPVQLERIRKEIEHSNKKKNVFYTSIKPKFLTKTIEVFIEIFKRTDLEKEKVNFNLIQLNTQLFHILIEQKVISINRLQNQLKTSRATLQSLIGTYEEANLLKTKRVEREQLVYLSEKGEKYYNHVLKTFEELNVVEKEKSIVKPDLDSIANYLYGLLISDSNGKTLVIVEAEPDSLTNALNKANNAQFDLELIGMFLNALQKFSEEINIKNLSNFRVQGANLKFSSISKKDLTLTAFTSPDMDIKHITDEFNILFDRFLDQYEYFIPIFNKTGNATPFLDWIPEAKSSLGEIVDKYKRIQIESESFDLEEAKKIYANLSKIDEQILPLEAQLNFKSLKVKILETILSEDGITFQKMIKEISKFIDIS